MSYRSRKIWTTAVAAAMLLSTVLTGCGGEKQETSTVETADLYTEVGTYPIVNEPISLTLFTAQRANIIDYETNEYTVFLEEKTGIDLTFETAPGDAISEKVNLAFASQDLPDMFFFQNVDEARYGVDEKQLIDLTELIDTKMPELQAIFEQEDGMREACKATDGAIYQLPSYSDCYHCNYAIKMWVNTAQLEAMGEEPPTTTEEFYNICKKFKEQNPDYLPLAGAASSSGGGWNSDPLMFIMNAFTYYPANVHGLRMHGDTVETAYNTDEYREALKFMARLYSEGLLYEATYTNTADQMKSLLVEEGEPVLFFPEGGSVNMIDTNTTPELYSHYYPIAPLKGPDGAQYTTHLPTNPSGMYSITTECQYPEAAVRLMDYLYSKEGWYGTRCGLEGTGWEKCDDSWYGPDGSKAEYIRLIPYSNEPQNHYWVDIIAYEPTEYRFAEAFYQEGEEPDLFGPQGVEALLTKATKELYVPYQDDTYKTLPPLKFKVDENQSVQTIKVELQKMIEESKVQFITGILDINNDADWQNYVDSLESIGMPKLVEVYQTAYDRQYK